MGTIIFEWELRYAGRCRFTQPFTNNYALESRLCSPLLSLTAEWPTFTVEMESANSASIQPHASSQCHPARFRLIFTNSCVTRRVALQHAQRCALAVGGIQRETPPAGRLRNGEVSRNKVEPMQECARPARRASRQSRSKFGK